MTLRGRRRPLRRPGLGSKKISKPVKLSEKGISKHTVNAGILMYEYSASYLTLSTQKSEVPINVNIYGFGTPVVSTVYTEGACCCAAAAAVAYVAEQPSGLRQ